MPVFVEAVHHVTPMLPAVFDRWLRFYVDVAVPAMGRHGFEIIGGWRRLTGEAIDDVILLRFANAGAWEEASQSLRADPAIAAGVMAIREEQPEFAVAEVTRLADPAGPTDEALAAARSQADEGPHDFLYVNSRTSDVPGLIAQLSMERQDEATVVVIYSTRVGARNEVTSIWMLPWGSASATLGARAGAFGGAAAGSERIDLMTPLPYSPLQ